MVGVTWQKTPSFHPTKSDYYEYIISNVCNVSCSHAYIDIDIKSRKLEKKKSNCVIG